ncbi:hypothetical protein PG985_005404 [Apiospora marii]|uniref:uncharacterized protein n=1 Tax=Apiospora marii TaxID=335849 RepID=UPI00312F09CF
MDCTPSSHISTLMLPLSVLSAAVQEFALQLQNSQAHIQRLCADRSQMQMRVAELVKEIEEMQAVYDLQEQTVQSQTGLIRALESEQICPSPFLKSADAYLPRPATLEPASPTQEYLMNNTNEALQPIPGMSEVDTAD